ncbi:MAG: copper chaperone PCu(A)C [Balneolaceae bacterium]|nr:copper chaperone PCu(A)C [Balneolaceae bacterium]
MNTLRTMLSLILLAVLPAACGSPDRGETGEGTSRELPEGQISVTGAWARPAAQGMTGGAYLTLHNRTAADDTLTGASASAASRADLHRSVNNGSLSGMRPAGPLAIPAGDSLPLAPGGYHLMFMRMERSTEPGDTLGLELHFASGDTLLVRLPVKLSGDS